MLRVLAYHRVAEPAATPDLDPRLVSARVDTFREQMSYLRRRYHPVAMADVIDAFAGRATLPERAVHVSVDDAYVDFARAAWPVLRELEIPVTVFVPSSFVSGSVRRFWWDRLHQAGLGRSAEVRHHAARVAAAALGVTVQPNDTDGRSALRDVPPEVAEAFIDLFRSECGHGPDAFDRSPVLGWDELRALQAEGVTFGAHTRTHAALSRVDPARARTEIRGSIDDLNRELGHEPRALAYPYGMHNAFVARLAREVGCALGFTLEDGLNAPGHTDPHRLRRTNITLRTTASLFRLRMQGWFAPLDRLRHRRQHARMAQ